MTEPESEYGERLRRALHAAADGVVPSGDGLERIRSKIAHKLAPEPRPDPELAQMARRPMRSTSPGPDTDHAFPRQICHRPAACGLRARHLHADQPRHRIPVRAL